MCYQNDYMRDFFYYNQNPNQNMNMNYNYMQNNYMFRNNNNNIENLYPNIYRILMPVVRKVVAGSNFQYLTEEVVSNIVDTVYNIVEGDRNVRTVEVNAEPLVDARRSNSGTTSNVTQTQTTTQSRTSSNNNNNSNNNCTEYSTLLKDLIRILVLQEIARVGYSRNNNMSMINTNMNKNMNMNPYQNQGYQNCCGGMGYM